jgi:diguanylate cyclase (GGDEF)-like protein
VVFRVLSYACFLAALTFLALGLAHHYRQVFPSRLVFIILLTAMTTNILMIDVDRNSVLRLIVYNAAYVAMGLVSAALVQKVRKRLWLDNVLLAVLVLFNVHFLLRPLSVQLFGGMGQNASAYLASRYAAFDQTTLAILGMALVLSLSLLLGRDVVSSLIKVSVTDPLSGLLNRRGFVDRATTFIQSTHATTQQVFLVMADIDYFKSINDKFGHETGDRVIQAFGDLLGMLSGTGTSVARVGGEEFAVLFASPNEQLARLYCESVRTAAEVGVADKNRDLPRFTASFGLAALAPGETIESLTRRADAALYRAKQQGRNRLAIAEPPLGLVTAEPRAA